MLLDPSLSYIFFRITCFSHDFQIISKQPKQRHKIVNIKMRSHFVSLIIQFQNNGQCVKEVDNVHVFFSHVLLSVSVIDLPNSNLSFFLQYFCHCTGDSNIILNNTCSTQAITKYIFWDFYCFGGFLSPFSPKTFLV